MRRSIMGKAVEFNGVDDALFVDVHPLAPRQLCYRGRPIAEFLKLPWM
jgi:hypothetical protein